MQTAKAIKGIDMPSDDLAKVNQKISEHSYRLDALDRDFRLIEMRVNDTDGKIDRLAQQFDSLAADTRAEYKQIDEKLDRVLEQFNRYQGAIGIGRWLVGIGFVLITTVVAVASYFKEGA